MPAKLPLVEVIIPVYNEEKDLAKKIPLLHGFLSKQEQFAWRITIADNASTDSTPAVAKTLCKSLANIACLRIPIKGRGIALRTAWQQSKADVLSYMDVDLSTDLKHFPQLVSAIINGADLATGSRLSKKSKTKRSFSRELLSRGYNLISRAIIGTKIKDLQCGFKAISRDAAKKLLPKVKDNEWFFDSELLLRAEKQGMKIAEIPVEWNEDSGSTVKIIDTVKKYLSNLWRLRKEFNQK